MQLKLAPCLSLLITGITIIMSSSVPVYAGGYCRHCNPCPNTIGGEIYGYFPTAWRAWPTVGAASIGEPVHAPATPPAPMPSTSLPSSTPEAKRTSLKTDKPLGGAFAMPNESRSNPKEEAPYTPPPQ